MAGTLEGGQKAAQTNKLRNPEFYTELGKMGGSQKNSRKGFGSNKKLAKTAGRLGGLSGRGKMKKTW